MFALIRAEWFFITIAAASSFFAILFARQQRLAITDACFVIVSSYFFASSVIGDYYLAAFLLVPFSLVMSDQTAGGVAGRVGISRAGVSRFRNLPISIIASSALLAPKNYIFFEGVSSQILINSLIMLFTTLLIFTSVGGSSGDSQGPQAFQLR
jgi:hypothetical protein